MTLTFLPSRCALHRARGKPPPPDTLLKRFFGKRHVGCGREVVNAGRVLLPVFRRRGKAYENLLLAHRAVCLRPGKLPPTHPSKERHRLAKRCLDTFGNGGTDARTRRSNIRRARESRGPAKRGGRRRGARGQSTQVSPPIGRNNCGRSRTNAVSGGQRLYQYGG